MIFIILCFLVFICSFFSVLQKFFKVVQLNFNHLIFFLLFFYVSLKILYFNLIRVIFQTSSQGLKLSVFIENNLPHLIFSLLKSLVFLRDNIYIFILFLFFIYFFFHFFCCIVEHFKLLHKLIYSLLQLTTFFLILFNY